LIGLYTAEKPMYGPFGMELQPGGNFKPTTGMVLFIHTGQVCLDYSLSVETFPAIGRRNRNFWTFSSSRINSNSSSLKLYDVPYL